VEPFRRILCPIDFSETSEHAFRYADRLAQASGAELLLLHAFDRPQSYDLFGQTHPADPALRAQLEAVKSASSNVRVTHAVHAGPPGEVICWFGESQNCDLIVIGTHGRTGLKHLLLGSVAEHVVRHARSPVLVVRLRAADEPPLAEPIVAPLPAPRLM
jgi:universal stress protein A